jgi:N-acetylglutamate synthase-like GNAT family acetyltransferase/protein-tyrosine-phosphatase
MTTAYAGAPGQPLRVLFLCTGNSARSQMAEALLNHKGKGRFHAESAGSRPSQRVNPYAIEILRRAGIAWAGRAPRGMDGLEHEPWDFVITVCDRAKEACPFFPGQPIVAHWGLDDPADAEGPDGIKLRAFNQAYVLLARRIDLLLALPIEKLQRLALESRVRAIGGDMATTGSSYRIRPATPSDLRRVETLLTASALPLAGVADALSTYVVAESGGLVVGVTGLEIRHDVALLRSAAVAPEWQGRGLGRALVEHVIADAGDRHLRALFLLTTTAEDYFPRFGFTRVSRDAVPAALLSTAEFSTACPASAVVMEKRLAGQ